MPRFSPKSLCNIKEVFARRFKAWRKSKRLPLKAVAVELGVSESALCQWENGITFPSAENLALISAYTGIPPCRFLCIYTAHCQSPCKPMPT